MKPTQLFSEFDLGWVLEGLKEKVRDLATKVSSERLAVEEVDLLANEVAQKIRVNFIVLDTEAVTVQQKEMEVDVSRDPMRHIIDRSRPFYINGINVSYFVPFTGDPYLLKCRPNSFTTVYPYASVDKNELIFEFSVTDGDVLPTKQRFEKELALVKQYVGWIEGQVKQYNESLIALIRPHLETRRQNLEVSKSRIADLGFALRTNETPVEAKTEVHRPRAVSPSRRGVESSPARKKAPTAEKRYDVALSFAGENREYVNEVANLLKDAHVSVFYDDFEKVDLWGKNLIDHLEKVYSQQSTFIVMFISEHYAIKSWPNHERKSAQGRAVKMQEDCILPVRFDDTEIPGMPDSVGFIDARITDSQSLSDLIIAKLGRKPVQVFGEPKRPVDRKPFDLEAREAIRRNYFQSGVARCPYDSARLDVDVYRIDEKKTADLQVTCPMCGVQDFLQGPE